MRRLDNMKILTIGLSPFYNTRNSKIHDDIIRNMSLSTSKIELASIFLDHDTEYFPQESIQSRYSGVDGKFYSTCEVGDQLVTSVFDIIEVESPSAILSIGSFSELEHTRAIKRVIPDSFNWIVILTSNIDHRVLEFSETLREADHVICLTNQSYSALKDRDISCSLFEYGIDDICIPGGNNELRDDNCPTFIINDKNVQQSNLALALDTFSMFKDENFKLILHTNYYEQGDYDLEHLTSQFRAGQIEIPCEFVSLKEGLSKESLIKKHSRAHFVIDLSIKPITSLCVLEGMSQGCVPIINKSGLLYEKIIKNDKYYKLNDFLVDNNLFFGEYLEPFYMASQDSFFNKLSRSFGMINENIEEYMIISELSRLLSLQFLSKDFCNKICNFITDRDWFKKELKLKVENT